MPTLYRQYRPTTFKEIVGQDHVTETLQAAILKNRLTHAYLFHGPRGTGKTTTARILAKRVNCTGAKGAEPCGKCKSCKASAAGNNIDLIEIDAASNRGIDDIRALRERISSAPNLGKYKVYIIDEVHMLTPEASTALLKTLEEPVKHAIFILATTELHKVLSTILSRCQVYRFRRASQEEMMGRLKYLLKKEKRTADDEVLEFIVGRSDGCYRDAESLLGQLLTLQAKKLTRNALVDLLGLPPQELLERWLEAMLKEQSALAIEAVDEAFAQGYDPEQFLRESILLARDRAIGETADQQKWSVIVRALLQAIQDLSYVPQPMVALHLAIITVCSTKGLTAPKKIEKQGGAVVDNTAVQRSAPKEVRAEQEKPTEINSSRQGLVDQPQAEEVKRIWPNLISEIKAINPVASTFLRAVEPLGISGDEVTLQTRYSLHKNFFDTPKHKTMVEEIMSKLLNRTVATKYILDEAGTEKGETLAEQRKTKEDKFYETVKEVFA